MTDTPELIGPGDSQKWYEGVTRYQWIVLLIASLGWVFDIFEGQIFVASMNEAMPSLMERAPEETIEAFDGRKRFYDNIALGAFLLGGATGGILFGMLSDRIGRKRTMTFTILFYSLFTCLSAFSMEWWHLAGLRFLVAMGVGGEWAVASSLVFEVFPARARAHAGGIFHASSIFGTWLATAAGFFIIANNDLKPVLQEAAQYIGITNETILGSIKWRAGFALGALPALLILWIRRSLREPESWEAARQRSQQDESQAVGRIGDLFTSHLLRNTLVGFTLAAVGLATFWGVHIYGKNLLQDAVKAKYAAEAASVDTSSLSGEEQEAAEELRASAIKRWEMIGMFLVTTGGGLGLVCFGPFSQRVGRRPAFLAYHVLGLLIAIAMFQLTWPIGGLVVMLPIFGFLTLGMHAGYAIYFPELFPTRLRGTGSGFCFNGGRIAAAPILFIIGWLQQGAGLSLYNACTLLSSLYLLGVLVLIFAPETRGQKLPE